jgi:hypothetical protein
VSWIYLPAGLRLFLILIFGLSGAIGIGLISGFAPLLANWVVVSNTQINNDLSNLSMQKTILCIAIYALMSSGFHQY